MYVLQIFLCNPLITRFSPYNRDNVLEKKKFFLKFDIQITLYPAVTKHRFQYIVEDFYLSPPLPPRRHCFSLVYQYIISALGFFIGNCMLCAVTENHVCSSHNSPLTPHKTLSFHFNINYKVGIIFSPYSE